MPTTAGTAALPANTRRPKGSGAVKTTSHPGSDPQGRNPHTSGKPDGYPPAAAPALAAFPDRPGVVSSSSRCAQCVQASRPPHLRSSHPASGQWPSFAGVKPRDTTMQGLRSIQVSSWHWGTLLAAGCDLPAPQPRLTPCRPLGQPAAASMWREAVSTVSRTVARPARTTRGASSWSCRLESCLAAASGTWHGRPDARV